MSSHGYDASELIAALCEVTATVGTNREVLLSFHDGKQPKIYTVFDVDYDDGYVVIHIQEKQYD